MFYDYTTYTPFSTVDAVWHDAQAAGAFPASAEGALLALGNVYPPIQRSWDPAGPLACAG